VSGAIGEASVGLAAVVDAIRGSGLNVVEQSVSQTESECWIAVRTGRSATSYGEWVVVHALESAKLGTTLQCVSWNVEPTLTFGQPRRNVRRVVEMPGVEARLLRRSAAMRLVTTWREQSQLTVESGTLCPAWIER
jgi:hypothetical protein